MSNIHGLDPGQTTENRTGDALIDAAADGVGLNQTESDDLVAFYLSNRGLPDDKTEKPLTLRLGDGASAREFRCVIHKIEWSEWQDARERATDKQAETFDGYVQASWIVARALVQPRLGPVVARQQEEAKGSPDGKIEWKNDAGETIRIDPPSDAAHLLRRMFKKQSGALLELGGTVLKVSKLDNENDTVREIEAGKT